MSDHPFGRDLTRVFLKPMTRAKHRKCWLTVMGSWLDRMSGQAASGRLHGGRIPTWNVPAPELLWSLVVLLQVQIIQSFS